MISVYKINTDEYLTATEISTTIFRPLLIAKVRKYLFSINHPTIEKRYRIREGLRKDTDFVTRLFKKEGLKERYIQLLKESRKMDTTKMIFRMYHEKIGQYSLDRWHMPDDIKMLVEAIPLYQFN